MKTLSMIIGIVAATGAVYTLLNRKAKGQGTYIDNIIVAGQGWVDYLKRYGTQLKDRLLHHIKGPNGEDVFLDMYNRPFYMGEEDKRVYLENV